jgi:hypothetical protein
MGGVHQRAGARPAADVHGPSVQNRAPLLLGQGMIELTPRHVLTDLFDSDDLPVPAAEIVVQRLIDTGFEIKGPGTGPIVKRRRRSARRRNRQRLAAHARRLRR